MSELYNYEYYHCCCGPIAYEEPAHWVEFFGGIADRIVNDLSPKTVLDAGCAMGYLVAALRDRGVEAYGVDISQYAISKVREDIKQYCAVGSLTEPLPTCLPRQYDLIVTIEVLEHMYEEDGRKAISNLCALSDRIIFSSTPDDFTERTHFNVQQREYWARLFAAEGFFDDLNYRPTYLTAYASYFKKSGSLLRQIEDYERNIRISEVEMLRREAEWRRAVDDKERHIQNLSSSYSAEKTQLNEQINLSQQQQELIAQALAEKMEQVDRYQQQQESDRLQLVEQQEQIDQYRIQQEANRVQLAEQQHQICQLLAEHEEKLSQYRFRQEQGVQLWEKSEVRCNELAQELAHYQEHYHAAIAQREELKRQLAQSQYAYNIISNAFFWKITKPFRFAVDCMKSLLRGNHCTYLMCKGLKCWKENGFAYTWKKVQDRKHHRKDFSKVTRPIFTVEELERQESDVFPRGIKFSILVPLYNTPEKFLHEMIQSVLDQTYENWELCMADGSDKDNHIVEKICKQYTRKDSRILYRKLEENLGISENTNACIDMATGDYIALFDHDDLLHPAALREVMRVICEKNADFIYTDEGVFHNCPADAYDFHFKSDFAPDTLRSVNYICHLSVFKKQLLDEVGNFRPECDGSQDFDMILRLTERAQKICHIPLILYYWRSHPQSTASNVGTKPYVIEAGHRALRDHLQRIGLEGEVLDTVIPTMYRIRYKIEGNPLVSIVIPNQDHVEDLSICLESIYCMSTYTNFEVIIVENNSKDKRTFEFYKEIEKKWSNLQVVFWNGKFNYAALNNFGVGYTHGKYVVLLNNDTEVISPEWIEEMLMLNQRDDVGAVGAKLYYPDDTIQHAGVIIGIGSTAGHQHKGALKGDYGYLGRLIYVQNLSAVTGACMMIRRDVWDMVGGLDEKFVVAFNDIDVCLRIRQKGYLIVWTPYAELYHYESKSRGYEDTPEKQRRFQNEARLLRDRWARDLAIGDPYYNPNLTLDREDFSLK